MTHAYHFFENVGSEGKGKLLYTPKNFELDGKIVKDPVDEVVAQLYDTGRKENDDSMKAIGSKIKRKRHFFMNIILCTEDGPVFKVLKDTSNEGKLIKEICKHAGFPFFRDVQDEWVVAETLEVDEDQVIVDLISVDEGHDFKIKRVKTGNENWDFAYDTSIPVQKQRPLTEEEIEEFLSQRVDLRDYVQYEDYDTVKTTLDNYFDEVVDVDTDVDEDDDDDDDEEEVEVTPKKKKSSKKKKAAPPVDDDDDDEEEDEDFDLDELDDDEDDEDDED